jgi:DNA-binding response OmpR family regulator
MPKVLIVEDDRGFQRMYAGSLEAFELIQAYDWNDGLRLFQEHADSLDAIVLDGNLGNGDCGDTLAQAFRNAGYTGPMIATSHASETQEMLLESGCDHRVDSKFGVCDLLVKLLA